MKRALLLALIPSAPPRPRRTLEILRAAGHHSSAVKSATKPKARSLLAVRALPAGGMEEPGSPSAGGGSLLTGSPALLVRAAPAAAALMVMRWALSTRLT